MLFLLVYVVAGIGFLAQQVCRQHPDVLLRPREGCYSNPTSGPITISSAVINTTHTALITRPGDSMSNIR